MSMVLTHERLTQCLEELQLIRCSLLPGEILTFIDQAVTWEKLLEDPSERSPESAEELSPPHFTLYIDGYPVILDIEMKNNSDELQERIPMSHISVKGNLKRDEHARWQEVIREKELELKEAEFPTFELISLFLLPLLHEEHDQPSIDLETIEPETPPPASSRERYHALLTSHHIRSPHKIRSIKNWSSSLSITGFLKVGYPGVIYGEGTKENIEEFVDNIKNMQWLALRVRFLEPLPEEVASRRPVVPGERSWTEFQKVGEVVEEMRRIGREEYVVEMGIGSAGM
ncbi:hypothetical protein BDQ17DRAFT_161998 [Cyathus striatus]|nr:hypothetical protein BDQ17DRAFT_161998 [Cyathus striatus]